MLGQRFVRQGFERIRRSGQTRFASEIGLDLRADRRRKLALLLVRELSVPPTFSASCRARFASLKTTPICLSVPRYCSRYRVSVHLLTERTATRTASAA